jgi:ribosomal protein S18 acetylase RimI-like enzyme
MWVSPAARGQGVGERLITAVEDWASRAGARTVKLAVADGNERAIALYRRTPDSIGSHRAGSAPTNQDRLYQLRLLTAAYRAE